MSQVSLIDGHDDEVKQGDLISRSALLKEHCDGCPAKFAGTCSPNDPICGLAQLIYEAPAVDAVEVVCCKDCKHYAEAKGIDSGKPCGYGKCCCAVGIRGVVYDDDFCSYGERMDGE